MKMSDEKPTIKAIIKKVSINGTEKEIDAPLHNTQYHTYIVVVGTQDYSSDTTRNLATPFKPILDKIPITEGKSSVGKGSKLMFVHQGLRRLNLNRDIKYDFLLCSRGYTSKQINAIKEAVENTYKGKFVLVTSAKQIINYINTADVNKSNGISGERYNSTIKQLLFYSHGVVGEISLGLAPAGVDITEYSFEEKQVKQLREEAFTHNAHIYSFCCRTGLGNSKVDKPVYINPKESKTDPKNRYNLLSSESLAQKLANQTKSTVFAYLCRSDYEDTLFTKDELCFYDHYKAHEKGKTSIENKSCGDTYKHMLAPNYKLTEEEIKRKKEWNDIIKNQNNNLDLAIFDPDGARHPVKGGTTPEGTPSDMKTFKPQ